MTPDRDDTGDVLKAPRALVSNSGAPVLRLDGYEGPLDLLLALARAQRVDLARLSIADLAGQFAVAVEAATTTRDLPLQRLGEWLVSKRCSAAHAVLAELLGLPCRSLDVI